jgi:alpha/beta superfamily hydrolase
MERKSSEIIEDVISSLESLIDALDDEWHHNNEGEWRKADNIRNVIIPSAKHKFKKHLDEYIDRRIHTYMRT